MKLRIPKDIFDNPQPPRLFLCNTGKKIIGELPSYEVSLDAKWNAYAELSFNIDRSYVDVLTGEYKVNPLFDKAEGLRKVYVENIGYFVIQDPDTTYADKDSKTLSCFSSEYETGAKYLENFRINTGEVDSKEVLYNESVYGIDYMIDKDEFYKLALGKFDPYESYYIKDYTDSDSYVWQQVQISDESEYLEYDGSTVAKTLYVKKYPNVRFYWPTKPQLSLVHLILEKIPGWKVGDVDATLWRKERKFDEDRIAVYDFLMNEISETFDCVVEWDTINNKVNFYEEAEDGINDDKTVQTRFDTDVFISRENLASEINIKYSTDDIKTKLKVSGSDDLNIREINLGKNYIMNLDFYHTHDWMEQDLFEAYNSYLKAIEENTPFYTEAVQGWVAANNQWNDLMNAVPADGNVVLVGDPFKKLYCTYSPVDTAYYSETITDEYIDTFVDTLYSDEECETPIDELLLSNGDTYVVQGYQFKYILSSQNFKCIRHVTEDSALSSLKDKLKQYRVNEDTKANVSDNILLRLRNKDSDTVTIRIYNVGEKDTPEYLIQCIFVGAASGIESDPVTYTLRQWINGNLTAEEMGLKDYTVQYIGVMGAYFVLAKDETVKANLQDYGVMLLREKQEIYTTIFQTQTEAMYSQEKYQCTASDEAPTGSIAENTRWLDTDSNPTKLYVYTSGKWVEFEGDLSNYQNYQRYIDNYDKLKAVQEVLTEKEAQAEYWHNGYAVDGYRISLDDYDDTLHNSSGASLEEIMQRVAAKHFNVENATNIVRENMDTDLPLYTFTTAKYPRDVFAVYLKGTVPYVAYATSQGVYQAIMDRLSSLTELEKFFTEDQWIRLSPFIREDEFSDSNFLLTGYESEEERLKICEELMEAANKELNTLCQPSLEFSMDMGNILALPEFESLTSQFQLGNFVRVHIRDGYVKRARLLEVHLNFDDLSDFNCDFGNLVTTKSEIDKHADLLQQAVTAGKTVATAAGDWQRAVDKSNKLEEEIANGLQNAALEVGKASGQSLVWDQSGIWGRKLIDGTTDQYDDEQFRIINNKLVFSNDGFKTSKSVMGKFVIKDDNGNDVTRWGLLAEAMVGGYIEGSEIRGGNLRIGDGSNNYFQVSESGDVSIVQAGKEKYASVDAVNEIDNAYRFHIVLSYDKSTIFSDIGQECTITCKVYDYNTDITDKVISIGGVFSWTRISTEPQRDTEWNTSHIQTGTNANMITVDIEDVIGNSHFACSVDFDEKLLPSNNTNS